MSYNSTTSSLQTTQLLVDIEDTSVLRAIKTAIKQLKGVGSIKEIKPRVKMSEAEFCDMIKKSAQSVRLDGANQKRENESVQDYVNRLIAEE